MFYAENLEKVKNILNQLDPKDSASVRKAQEVVGQPGLQADLAFLLSHLSFLPKYISMLETKGVSLADSLSLMSQVEAKLDSIPGSKGELLQDKFGAVFQRNPGLNILLKINRLINTDRGTDADLPLNFSTSDVANFKFCPTTSVDVERSFSMFKNILSDRRQSLTQENLSRILVSNCFYNKN